MAGQQKLGFDPDFAAEIVDVPVAEEMSESFLAYSLSVITARAIPDVRDGLKPVQRRILYAMQNMGIRPDTPHRKCARVVGETMGRYHPHGDSAIYDTLVRMGQSFSRGITLIDPQGNFGSLDDPPAAARYTECRLTDAAMQMLAELGEDTVEFRTTYDGEGTEPVYLPARLPNLLVNGGSGIAVGMATNMAPHNLAEVYAAVELVMTKRRPKPTIDELLAVIPGPDFPSGGIIVDEGIREAYESGRGSMRVRARAEIEQLTSKRQGIIVTELPYMVGPEKVVAKVSELIAEQRVPGLDDVKNLSDRHQGTRIQIECKPGVNPHVVLQELYRLTPLEETFAINAVALVDGVPTTLGMYELCHHYVEHRLDVIVRRTRWRLERDRARLHIVEGLLIALDAIDLVVAIIRGSDTVSEARAELMERLTLTQIQTDAILEMQLRRLVALERQKLVEERDELLERIADYEALLASETRQRKLVLAELAELVDQFGHERRSTIISPDDIEVYEPSSIIDTSSVSDEPAVVTLATSGAVGRTPTEGAKRATPGRHDVIVSSALTSTADRVYAVTSDARVLGAFVHEIGEVSGRSRGGQASQLFGTSRGETVLAVLAASSEPVVLITANGVAKRITPAELAGTRTGDTVMNLREGDRLVAAFGCPDGADVVMVASDAQVLRTASADISVQGRGAAGVAGMKLRSGARLVGAACVLGDGAVTIATDRGAAKATPLEELETKGRNGQGVRLTKLDDEEQVTVVHVGPLDDLVATMGTDGDPTRPDPTPVPFPLDATKRDLVATTTDRPILELGPARW
ncbi:MAG: DNA topoisomerase (ATP-hydrolyzing) [Acidimicrobiales bacterium]